MLTDRFRLWGERWIEKGLWFLAPLSWLYALAVLIRNQLYQKGFFQKVRVDTVVISVGNIVAGGTGKTPFTQALARAFPQKKVAILSRGYGFCPDEAMLLKKTVPHAEVFVAKDRSQIAQRIAPYFDLILLDDGFQHRKLKRDIDVVLVRKQKEKYLPLGFLRDSPRRLKDAEFVFEEDDFDLAVDRILDLKGNEISSIQGWKVALFCGIARPSRFKKKIEEMGAQVLFETYFADHGKMDLQKLPKAEAYLCTEKDAVKIENTDLPIFYLQMQIRLTKGLPKWENLIAKISEKIENRLHV